MPLNPTAARCTAKSKNSKKRCKNAAVAGSDKCRMHGGSTPRGIASPQFKDGRRSKYSYLPKQITERIDELTADSIKNLEENISIQRGMESRLMERFTAGSTLEKWEDLQQTVNLYETACEDSDDTDEPVDPQVWLDRIIGQIAAGLQDARAEGSLRRELQVVHESQRKLTETLTRSIKERSETVTEDQLKNIFTRLLHVIRNNISDRQTLSRIQKGVLEIIEPEGQGLAVVG
jgi:hypothetical protein